MSEQPTTSEAVGVWIVFRFQHETRCFVATEVRGAWSGPVAAPLQFRMGEERGLVGLVGARGQALWLPNVREDARWVGMDDTIRSAYLTPIARQEETLGVLLLASRNAAGLDALHRSLADGVASGLAATWSAERSDSGTEAPSTDLSLLSQRERDVVNALCRGLRLSDIAKVLGISNHTARNHLKHVFRKLGVHSQVELLSLIGRRTGIPEAVN